MICIGIDLGRITGFAIVKDQGLIDLPCCFYHDDEIVAEVNKNRRKSSRVIVGIDAPLSFPEDTKIWRKCEKELHDIGISCYASGSDSGAIRNWVRRAINLKKILEKSEIECIEVYPYAARQISGIGKDQKKKSPEGREHIQNDLKRFVKNIGSKSLSHDELDAIICAYVTWLYGNNKARKFGDHSEGYLYLPQ